MFMINNSTQILPKFEGDAQEQNVCSNLSESLAMFRQVISALSRTLSPLLFLYSVFSFTSSFWPDRAGFVQVDFPFSLKLVRVSPK